MIMLRLLTLVFIVIFLTSCSPNKYTISDTDNLTPTQAVDIMTNYLNTKYHTSHMVKDIKLIDADPLEVPYVYSAKAFRLDDPASTFDVRMRNIGGDLLDNYLLIPYVTEINSRYTKLAEGVWENAITDVTLNSTSFTLWNNLPDPSAIFPRNGLIVNIRVYIPTVNFTNITEQANLTKFLKLLNESDLEGTLLFVYVDANNFLSNVEQLNKVETINLANSSLVKKEIYIVFPHNSNFTADQISLFIANAK